MGTSWTFSARRWAVTITSERPTVAAASPVGPASASAHEWAACALRMAVTALETLEFIFALPPGALSWNRPITSCGRTLLIHRALTLADALHVHMNVTRILAQGFLYLLNRYHSFADQLEVAESLELRANWA